MYKKLIYILLTIVTTIGLLSGLFFFNNKYNSSSKKSLAYLTNGYLYVDTFLEPSQINYNGLFVKVGQYQNYSTFHDDYSAFGKSTMVFSYRYSGTNQILSMYIQEPFSSIKVYVNGECVGQNGSFSPYQKDIKDMIVSFPAYADNEIVILTENRSHYYSGIQYPIAIGETASVQNLILQRTLTYSLFSFSSIAIALYSFILWYKERHQSDYYIHFDFGVFSVCFGIYSLYPFFPLLQISTPILIYALQDGLMMLSIFFAYIITVRISGYPEMKQLSIFSLSMCVICFIMPFLLPTLASFIPIYGWLISLYKIIIAFVMLYLSIKACIQKNNISLLLGIIVYGICLGMNVLTMNQYEPASTAWFEEFGMFALLLCFMSLMIQRTHTLWKEHQQLSFHLQEEVDRQTIEINNLMKERQQLLNELLHDLKRPISTAQTYLSLLQSKDIKTNQNLKEELQILQDKYILMNQQVKMLQDFNSQEQINLSLEKFNLQDFIQSFYQMYYPDSEAYDIDFTIHICQEECWITGDRQQLLRVLQNLFFNALNIKNQSLINISLKQENKTAVIVFEDYGGGISDENIKYIFDRGFTTKEDKGNQGLGLFIVKTIITLHHGTIDVISQDNKTQFIIRLPISTNN